MIPDQTHIIASSKPRLVNGEISFSREVTVKTLCQMDYLDDARVRNSRIWQRQVELMYKYANLQGSARSGLSGMLGGLAGPGVIGAANYSRAQGSDHAQF